MEERTAHSRSMLLLCLMLTLLAAVVVGAACTAPAEPTPTPARTLVPTLTPAPAIPEAQDDWARVKAAGVIEVASPLDNAPFNMYNENFKPDGFDVALMNDLGRRLGLRVQFVDVPFEGLLSGLQLGQFDAAIAAMAVTEDRLAQVDFTQTYYVGEDGILAAPDSDISSVTTKADIVNRQVGVVRGTVYEWWLDQNLVQTGEMPARNLHVYTRPDDAISELDAGYIDLVVLDREPALAYEAQGRATLVGKSKYSQNFAIPVRKGSTLLRHLNSALAGALADGTVSALIEQYLKIAKEDQLPIPTATPQPAEVATATPIPPTTPIPGACTPWAVPAKPADLNVPDNTVMLPGQSFTKGWEIVNSGGTCDWTADYSFVYAKGTSPDARMGGQDAKIGKVVPLNSSYEAWVPMWAPSAPGVYQAWWQMANAQGVPFGERVWVKIVVPTPTRLPPTPTVTPPANISWKVDRDHIRQGETATFTLNVTGVRNVYFNEQGQAYVGVPGQSTQPVRPSRDTTYQLRVEQNNGQFWNDYRTIYVTQVTAPPVITDFKSEPASEVTLGNSVTFWWNVQGATDTVRLLRNNSEVNRTSALSGSWTDGQPPEGTWTYELQAWGAGGSAVPARRQITVKRPPQEPPVISRFDVNPSGEMDMGGCVNISWDVEGTVDNIMLTANDNPLNVPSAHDSAQDCECPRNPGTCTYKMTAWGPGGNAEPRSQQVYVKEPAPANDCERFCRDQGGQFSMTQRGDGGQYGVCDFGDGMICEACAMMYGTCPVGGIRVTGYDTSAARYCAITGGQYSYDQSSCTMGGNTCDAEAYYNGQCNLW